MATTQTRGLAPGKAATRRKDDLNRDRHWMTVEGWQKQAEAQFQMIKMVAAGTIAEGSMTVMLVMEAATVMAR